MAKKKLTTDEKLKLKIREAEQAQREVEEAEAKAEDDFNNCLEVKLDCWLTKQGLNHRAGCHMMIEYIRNKGLEADFRQHLEKQ